ncbi:hypothetical protein BH24ACT3_BH24ACT3_04830 [soil metagenome]
MDPRMRARRIEVRRHAGRRRRRRLVALAGVAIVGATAGGLTQTPLLDVDRVRVDDTAHQRTEDVLDQVGVAPGEAMIGIDEGAAERRLRSLPWVADAEVRRNWPGTVAVRVTERRAVARLPLADGTWMLADIDGHLLEVVGPDDPGPLPVVGLGPVGEVGDTIDGDAAMVALQAADLLPADDAIAAVRLGPDGVEVALRDSGTARLGPVADESDLNAKLTALVAVLDELRLPTRDGEAGDAGAEEGERRSTVSCVAVIDLQVPATPVLTPGPSCA